MFVLLSCSACSLEARRQYIFQSEFETPEFEHETPEPESESLSSIDILVEAFTQATNTDNQSEDYFYSTSNGFYLKFYLGSEGGIESSDVYRCYHKLDEKDFKLSYNNDGTKTLSSVAEADMIIGWDIWVGYEYYTTVSSITVEYRSTGDVDEIILKNVKKVRGLPDMDIITWKNPD